MRRRILFYCQPMLGLGHLTRSLAILRGLARFDIWMVNGGRPLPAFLVPTLPPHLTIVQLPPLQADPAFETVESVTTSGDDRATIEEERRTALLDLLRRVEPEIILIELFPFGRLPFAGEILPLLDAARAQAAAVDRPLRIVCSLRDILVEKRDPEQFEQFVLATANRYFDLILVHADPAFQRLDETFPKVGELACPVVYTGYVAEGVAAPGPAPPREALVVASIGGGRVGSELLDRVASASEAIQASHPHRLILLTGPYIPEEEERALRARWGHSPHLTIERFEVDFVGLLRRACLSISLAGYNTSMNVLSSGVPAILSPYTGNRNREQSQRAARLAAAGWVRLLPATAETTDAHQPALPDPLSEWMKEALTSPPPARQLALRLDGVETTARLLEELLPPRADHPAEDRSGESV